MSPTSLFAKLWPAIPTIRSGEPVRERIRAASGRACRRRRSVMQRILRAKTFVACVLAAVTGIFLYFRYPFPERNFYLELVFLWARPIFHGLKYSYTLFLYTTPYIIYSFLLSGLYIF